MKNLTNFLELIIIVCVAVIIVLSEMLYFAMDRAIEKVQEVAGEL